MTIQPRPRQAKFIDACLGALAEHKDTLGVAPTGAGKTVIASHVVRNVVANSGHGAQHLFLQHRDELVEQNSNTLYRVDKSLKIGFVTADKKRWASGGVTYAMIQTLSRSDNLEAMPPLASITIDEAHHAAADSYLRVIARARSLNPDLKLFGVTATPNRGDRKSLKGVFSNVADQISIGELVSAGFLVRPRGFAIDVGVSGDLQRLDEEARKRKWSENELLTAADKLLNKSVVTDKVIEEWKARAGSRQTVVFCSTVDHAEQVSHAFNAAGVSSAVITGDMNDGDRKSTLRRYDKGEIQVICNVAVLTEGWDHQPTSCVILLRPSSYKSTMMQMVGRGLRTVDPERYPGVTKDDCIILDFGTSLLRHGNLEVGASLEGDGVKVCPECDASVPKQCTECPICGFEFPKAVIEAEDEDDAGDGDDGAKPGKSEIGTFIMRELSDLLQASPYRWEPFFQGVVMIADAIDAWACVVNYQGRWYAIGGARGKKVMMIGDNAEQIVALALADDYLRTHGDPDTANKSKRWLSQPPSDKQLELLGINTMQAMTLGINRYRASTEITWRFNQRAIQVKLTQRNNPLLARAS
jgi:superfamily II DNA or RNA helicase